MSLLNRMERGIRHLRRAGDVWTAGELAIARRQAQELLDAAKNAEQFIVCMNTKEAYHLKRLNLAIKQAEAA